MSKRLQNKLGDWYDCDGKPHNNLIIKILSQVKKRSWKTCKTKKDSGSETEEIKKYEPSEKETIDKDSLIIELLKQNK